MKKFIVIEHKDSYGFISTNLRSSVWGIAKQAKLNEVLDSLREDYGNVQFSFPKSAQDDLDSRDALAYYKLVHAMQKQEVAEALRLRFGVNHAEI